MSASGSSSSSSVPTPSSSALSHSQSSSSPFSLSSASSVHLESFRTATVLDHLKRWRVACCCCWGDSLLVGCSDGCLRQFEGDEEKVVWREKMLDDAFGGSKKSIEQLQVVDIQVKDRAGAAADGAAAATAAPAAGKKGGPGSAAADTALLLSIANGVCRVHTLPGLRSLSLLAESKGAYLLALSCRSYSIVTQPTPSSPRVAPLLLCLATKRKQLLFYSWRDGGSSAGSIAGDFAVDSMVPVDDTVRCIEWADRSVVVGVGREYAIVRHDGKGGGGGGSERLLRLFDCGKKAPHPVATLVEHRVSAPSAGRDSAAAEREVVLVQDQRGVCINEDGQPTRKESLTFSDIPSLLLSCPPYLLALLPSCIEIRQIRSGLLAQSIPCKEGAKWLERRGQSVFVAGPGWGRCLFPIPLRELVDDCMKRGAYREAQALVQTSDDMQWRGGKEEREQRLNDVYSLAAYDAFNHGDYQQAMVHFQQSAVDPVHVISLFPDVLPSHAQQLLQSMHIAQIKHPVRVSSAQGEQALLKALAALIPYLANMQNKIRLQQQQGGGGAGGGAAEDEEAAAVRPSRRGHHSAPISIPTSSISSLASLIDTVLLKAYLLSDIPLLPFLQQPNACDVSECAAVLRAYEKYPELVCLYQQHGEHREALELLQSIGQASLQLQKQSAAGGGGAEQLKPSQQPLAGVEPCVVYLQRLAREGGETAMQLVAEYSKWIFAADPDAGLRIFTVDQREEAESGGGGAAAAGGSGRSALDPHAVFAFLRSVTDREHCIRYLEWLIGVCRCSDSVFHNELVFLYLDAVLRIMKLDDKKVRHAAAAAAGGGAAGSSGSSADGSPGGSGSATPVSDKGKKKTSAAGSRRTSASLAATSFSSALSPAESAHLLSLRSRLYEFLRSSLHYNPERMLSKFPRNHLLEERCVLLSRVGQHEEALTILAHRLRDPEAAERYCITAYNQSRRGAAAGLSAASAAAAATASANGPQSAAAGSGEAEGNDLFLLLLKVYLLPSATDPSASQSSFSAAPPPASSSSSSSSLLLSAAVSLLTHHCQHIDPIAALELLPASTPISLLQPYLLRVLRQQRHRHRAGEIVKQLHRAEHLNTRLLYLDTCRQGTVMTEHTLCERCGKRIGGASFARYPDGSVLHYLCHRALQQQTQQQP